jgi:hypothetical protein
MIRLDEHTNVHNMIFANYGPNAYECARNIRNGLFRDEIRIMLKKNHFALITDIPAPRRVPELFEGEWWNRVDINAHFNEFERLESEQRTVRRIHFDVSFPNRSEDEVVVGEGEAQRPSCKNDTK